MPGRPFSFPQTPWPRRSTWPDRGSPLPTSTSQTVTIDGLDWLTAQHGTAYDLTVGGLHTYFVVVDASAVLVYNTCGLPDYDIEGSIDRTMELGRTHIFKPKIHNHQIEDAIASAGGERELIAAITEDLAGMSERLQLEEERAGRLIS
jgi:hypothetical protein